MSPPYTQLPILTSMAQLRKSCINEVNSQRCRRKALCTKSDVWKAEHTALLRDFVLSWHRLSQEDRAAKVKRFAELSVCSVCDAEVGEISNVTDEQMQTFMEILFPDGLEEMDGDDMAMLGADDDRQQEKGDEHGYEQAGKEEQNVGAGPNAATQPQATPPPATTAHSVITTPTKSQQSAAYGAQADAAIQNQATEATNKKPAKSEILLKALVIALFTWMLICIWMLSPVVLDEILYGVFNRC